MLVLNGGSASFKWTLFGPAGEEVRRGAADGVDDGLERALAALPRPDAVGHRVVHGGHAFTQPVRLEPPVREAIESLVPLAPLHQPLALRGIDRVAAHWPGIAQVACFDTAFHASLPPAAACYAVPREWSERYGLRRFGAHGLSVEWAVRRIGQWPGPAPRRVVVCHLGGGSSITAVENGASIDTTMGYTPLEGVVMGTRSGSVDPGVVLHLLRERAMPLSELSDGLVRRGGLLGLSGISSDLRVVRAAALRADPAAAAAIDHLLWTYRRAAGAMCGVLGGVDAVVFTGGVGEHQPFVRSAIASALPDCRLDAARNDSTEDDGEISAAGSRTRAFVVTCREDRVIHDHMLRLLER